jgi:hypothetical protein
MSDEPDDPPTNTPESGAVRRAKQLPPVETRWKPGQSGNPSGRPKALGAIKAEFMPHVPAVLKKLLMRALSDKGSVGVAAAKEFLDRVLGKAAQPIVGEEGATAIHIDIPGLIVELRRYVEDETEKEENA